MPDEFEDEESPKSKTGRFFVPHRGDTRVEVGEPINVGGDRPWLCAVKLMGKTEVTSDGESTQTLFLRTGRGSTPEEAQREAMAQLALVVGSPVGPAPSARISRRETDPPPSGHDTERRMPVATVPPPSRDFPTERDIPVAAPSGDPPTEPHLRVAQPRPTEPAPKAPGFFQKLIGGDGRDKRKGR
jgi:hypothetical protein